jgi:hypothetical protein
MTHYSGSARPNQIKLCLQAAEGGDLDGVKEQVQQLLHSPDVSFLGEQPDLGWLHNLLLAAIQRGNVDMVQYLLDEKVVTDGEFPAETAVRARAFDVLELYLGRGWDINQPNGDEPPVLV